jgi:hypothetical protein
MLEDKGRGMIYVPTVNYRDGNLDMVKEMLEHPLTLPGLSDGGAHVLTAARRDLDSPASTTPARPYPQKVRYRRRLCRPIAPGYLAGWALQGRYSEGGS